MSHRIQKPSWWARLRDRLRGMPRFMPSSSLLAFLLFAGMVMWIVSGLGERNQVDPVPSILEQIGEEATDAFAVQTQIFIAETHPRQFAFRARSEAARTVQVAAETSGKISALPIAQGEFVKSGTVICRIDVGARRSQFQEAEAQRRKSEIDYRAAQGLVERGYMSLSEVAGNRASLDAAAAMVEQRRVELERTAIAMPFDAILDELLVEKGDFIAAGQACARVVDKDPLLITAQISEEEVGHLQTGLTGYAKFVTGEQVEGEVRYISETPDPQTRTFRLEMEVPNPNLTLRDGITAEVHITGAEVLAHKLPQGILTLSDDGVVGVKAVVDSTARFKPVIVIADELDGAWVTGLQARETLIVLGQEFVLDGQEVNAFLSPQAQQLERSGNDESPQTQ